MAAVTTEAAGVCAGQSGNNPLEEAAPVEVCGILGSELIHISGGHLRERQTIRLSGPFPGLELLFFTNLYFLSAAVLLSLPPR